jgi:TonB family protein
MKAIVSFALILLFEDTFVPAKLDHLVTPAQPVMSLQSGQVLLDVHVRDDGRVGVVRTLYGQSPFLKVTLEAVRQWHFVPARQKEPVDSRVGVLAIFYPRQMFSFSPPRQEAHDRQHPEASQPPLPLGVSHVGYPANSVAEGVVLIQLRVDREGAVAEIQLIRDVKSLGETALRAVRSWKFSPAKVNGEPIPGTMIVAVSFLRPFVRTRGP